MNMKEKNVADKKRSTLVKLQTTVLCIGCVLLVVLPSSSAERIFMEKTKILSSSPEQVLGLDDFLRNKPLRWRDTYITPLENPLPGDKYKLSEGWCIKKTTDGGCIVCGENEGWKQSNYSPPYDVLMLTKYNANGQEEWNTTWKGLGDTTMGFSVQQTTDGGYISTGLTLPELIWEWNEPPVPQIFHLFLVKTDAQGRILWTQTFPELPNSGGNTVIQTTDGGYTIVGAQGSDANATTMDLLVIQTNNQGTLQQYRTIHQTGFSLSGSTIVQASDQSFVIWGNKFPIEDQTQCNPFMMKLNEDLTTQWTRNYTLNDYTEIIGDGRQTAEGGYLIYGSVLLEYMNVAAFVIKTDDQGAEQWNNTYQVQGNTQAISAAQTSDQGYVLTGFTHYPDPLQSRGYFLKINSTGTVEWNKTFDFPDLPNNGVLTYSLDRMTDDKIYVSGLVLYTGTITNWDGKCFVIKADALGNEIWRKTFQWSDTKNPGMVNIVQPTNAIYLYDKSLFRFPTPVILGWIFVKVNATDNETGIDHIDFYLDDKLYEIATMSVLPFEWLWYEQTFFKHTMRAVAYDKEGNSVSSDEITVHKFSTVIGFILWYYLNNR